MLSVITVYAGDFGLANGIDLRDNRGEPASEIRIKGNLSLQEIQVSIFEHY